MLLQKHCFAEEIRTVKVLSLNDPQAKTVQYFHTLLELALEATIDTHGPFKIEPVEFNVGHARSIKMLKNAVYLDVLHTSYSPSLEKDLISVKVPLLNGALGTRALLVNRNNKAKFESMDAEDLKQLIACQGLHWVDSDILEHNGYTVYRLANFPEMMRMLAINRCDYFPRSISEINADFERFNGEYGQLAIVNNLLLKYESPMYFYLAKSNQVLAKRIELGLNKIGGSKKIQSLLDSSDVIRLNNDIEANPDVRILQLERPPGL